MENTKTTAWIQWLLWEGAATAEEKKKAYEVLLPEQEADGHIILFQTSSLSSAPWWHSLSGMLAKERGCSQEKSGLGLQVCGKGEVWGSVSQSCSSMLAP